MSTPQMNQQPSDGGGNAIVISSDVMVGAIVFFFMVVVFVFFLHLYAKWQWGPGAAARRARSRFIFAQDQDPLTAPRCGLDPAVILSLPVSIYRSEDFKEGLECAVCLSDLTDGEKARLLPKCNHGFHLECIDMWFHSHSTCPLCRNPVGPETDLSAGVGENPPSEPIQAQGYSNELPNLPTNVLFWGTQDQVTTGGASPMASQEAAAAADAAASSSSSGKPGGMLVIEIPRRMMEVFPSPLSPLPSSRLPMEEMKSPATPASTRLRSLRRLLTREKKVAGSSCSPCGGDIEQGVVGVGGGGSGILSKSPTSS